MPSRQPCPDDGEANPEGMWIPRPPLWAVSAFLAAVTLALYWPAMRAGFITVDDPVYVTANPHLHGGLAVHNVYWAFTTAWARYWHPVTWLSLMLDVNLFGGGPAGFHFTNLLLHALNTLLLFWLLRQLTGAVWRSACVAALFAWHPIHVESVAWIAERKDVLSAFFGFLSLLFYAFYGQAKAGANRCENHVLGERVSSFFILHSSFSYWLAVAGLALGLMSKPMLVTWPLVLLLLDCWPLGRWHADRAWPLVREKIPFAALAAAVSAVTFEVQKRAGFVASTEQLPPEMRVENVIVSYCRYLIKLFWPADLSIFYPYIGIWPTRTLLAAIVFLTVASGTAYALRRRCPWLTVGWLWYVVTLLPVIGFVQVAGQSIADRYAYIPSVGVLVIAVWGAHTLGESLRAAAAVSGKTMMAMLAMPGSAALLACLFLSRHQLWYWQNNEALFRHALEVTQNNPFAHENYGLALADLGRLDAAVGEYQQALRLDPANAEAHNSLGITLAKQGQIKPAVAELEKAVLLDPRYGLPHRNLALLEAMQGHSEAATSHWEALLRISPDDPFAHSQLASMYARQGRMGDAINQWRAAVDLNPDDAASCDNLGVALAQQGKLNDAIALFKQALRVNPNDGKAQVHLANAEAAVKNRRLDQ